MKTFIVISLVIALVFFGYSLSSCVFMFLWNWVIVDLFSAPIINFWQSLAIIILFSFVGGAFKSR